MSTRDAMVALLGRARGRIEADVTRALAELHRDVTLAQETITPIENDILAAIGFTQEATGRSGLDEYLANMLETNSDLGAALAEVDRIITGMMRRSAFVVDRYTQLINTISE